MTRFLFGRYVESALREIRDYLARENPKAARQLMVQFVAAFRLLARHPKLGTGREELSSPPVRFWPVGAYLVIYVFDRQPIEIVGVVHGARDVPYIVNRSLDGV